MDGHHNINYRFALPRVIASFMLFIYFTPCLVHHSVMSLFRTIEAVTLRLICEANELTKLVPRVRIKYLFSATIPIKYPFSATHQIPLLSNN